MAIDFTTLARVKAYLDIPPATTANDVMLQTMITSVSATLEQSLNRTVKTETKTETYNAPRTGRLLLTNGPATSVTSITYSPSGLFARDGVALSTNSYGLDDGGDTIVLPDFATQGGKLRVVYVGGMGADTAALLVAYPVLDQAATMQVAYLWARRKTPGRTSTDIGNGQTQWTGDYDLLPAVVSMLMPLRHVWACF